MSESVPYRFLARLLGQLVTCLAMIRESLRRLTTKP